MNILIRFLILSLLVFACGGENEDSYLKSGTSMEELRPVSSACFKPRQRGGSRCSFYRECLEASITCEGTDFPYAISYGEKYCNRFEELTPRLSDPGKQWASDTLYCLQEAVVLWNGDKDTLVYLGLRAPLIHRGPEVYDSCQNIRGVEFMTHPRCYLGGPSQFSKTKHTSICSLGLKDSWRIISTVSPKDLFTVESGIQVMEVSKACIPQYAAPFVVPDRQKLYDFWNWAYKKGEANSKGLPEPPVPASIAAEVGELS